MSNKRKRKELAEKKARVRLCRLEKSGRIANGVVMPEGAIAADLTKHAKNNSYSPPLFYVDQPFTCVDCGVDEVWTAKQQQWYYEVAKGPIQARAIRCRACRKARREMQERSRAQQRKSE
jgi:hypothetical protein